METEGSPWLSVALTGRRSRKVMRCGLCNREEVQERAPWTGEGKVNRNKRWGVTVELAMARPLVVEAELI